MDPASATYKLFDANCLLGRHMRLQANQPHTAADLLADMDHIGVSEALVLDCLSRENHPIMGNERILEFSADQPRLHPAWAVMPHAPDDEQPQGKDLLDAMREHHVGALFLFPEQYNFTLSDWSVDSFLEPLAAVGVPLFINYNEVGQPMPWDQTDWDPVVALCKRFPNLPIIVSENRMRRSNRQIYRALETCSNLRIELSGYWLHRGIEYITETFGAHRLIYGSNWPHHGHGDTTCTLTTADISDQDKRLIAGDNLRALIAWCDIEHPDVSLPDPADEFVRFGQTGVRPDDMTFADNHGHMGGLACHYHLPNGTLDGIVADQERFGIEKSIIFSFSGIFSDEQPGNDIVAQAVAAHPDFYVGLTMLNPSRGEDMMLAELERGKAMGLRGVKLIPTYQGYPEEGPSIDIACQWADEQGLIMLNHHWGSAEQMERLVSTYPNVCFMTGHTTTAYAHVMKRYDNLYVCSCPLIPPSACADVVSAIGADRLMFGSDLQDLPIAWGLGPIVFSRIPPEDKKMILGDNLRRVLDQYGYTASQPVAADRPGS